jgi:predicted amidohydrolase
MANEHKYFSAGGEIVVTKINDFHFGLSICYDLRFPELYRLLTLKGADVLVNIANWPVTRINHWKLLTEANAVQQLSYFIGVNRTGKDPYNEYNGFSRVVSPMGEVLAESENREEIIVVEIDPDEVKSVREKLPFLNDVKLIKKKSL